MKKIIIISLFLILIFLNGCTFNNNELIESKCLELKIVKLKLIDLNDNNHFPSEDVSMYNELCGDVTGKIE